MPTLLVGTRKGLFILDGDTWRTRHHAFRGDPVSMVLHDPRDGRLYAALHLGHYGVKLHASDDGGATWSPITTPAYPAHEGADGPSVDQVWELALGAGPGQLWCGTIPGGLFRSDDRGATWTLCSALWGRPERDRWMGGGADKPGVHSVLPDPRDPRRLLVGVSCGGVWFSPDDGESWEQRGHGLIARFMPPELELDPTTQDPHLLARCAAAPDVIWCQHHCGIFRSIDDGRTFVELHAQPSSFGFAVAAHPTEPDTAWFVPAEVDQRRIPVDGRVVVTRTTDAGTSFTALRDGLPQDDAWDLTLRHALALAPDGRTLAFGSTTGNCWASTDAGETWRVVSHHLPPIYVVRFGA